ncbi:hypothetical protein [Desulfolutivibrio sulfoxidireducens]|uniref:hypothetical protein n=1 Tax=Desulfolutivibrio sulfoxidireducens TaxID=2773299 RepID=UPI00159D416C|nr:hypothetical protein [Desulfolutivibrio sulfoxidireducens]QLA20693.1 hypothetical protein GD604_13710 [Desulfolutivibrio sulfoxidireducens]
MPQSGWRRFAVFGMSGGGFAPRSAQHDPRIKAVAMNARAVDAHSLFASMTPATTATPETVATWTSSHADMVEAIAWRWGGPMGHVSGLVEAIRATSRRAHACPGLRRHVDEHDPPGIDNQVVHHPKHGARPWSSGRRRPDGAP